jgi:hypothetical protein
MANYTWQDTLLQPSDLHEKARRFIEMMGIDVSNLTLMHLTLCPDGKFFNIFDNRETGEPNPKCAASVGRSAIYFFTDYKKAGVAIHELAHIYFKQAKFYMGIEYDLRAMGEKFIAKHGIKTLSRYAQVSVFENAWEEVVCEIIATYGRRGQFNKIKELLNQ